MALGTLVLRLFVGGAFAAHGLQKLRGWFSGPGIDGVEKMTASLGIEPARPNAYAVALTETVGGLALAAGAATPVAATGLTAAMTTAIRKVHAPNGFFTSKGGWEFNGTLVAAVLAITADGPGRYSLDAAFGRKRWGLGWALGALALGIAASFAVTELGSRAAATLESDSAGEPGDTAAS